MTYDQASKCCHYPPFSIKTLLSTLKASFEHTCSNYLFHHNNLLIVSIDDQLNRERISLLNGIKPVLE